MANFLNLNPLARNGVNHVPLQISDEKVRTRKKRRRRTKIKLKIHLVAKTAVKIVAWVAWTVAVVAVLVPVEVHEKCNSEAKDRQCFNWVNHDDIYIYYERIIILSYNMWTVKRRYTVYASMVEFLWSV